LQLTISLSLTMRQANNTATLLPNSGSEARPIPPIPVYSVPLKDNTLVVNGLATVNVPTDIIKLGLTVETNNTQAGLALQQNNEIAKSVDDILTNLNIPLANITTTSFSIAPDYDTIYNPEDRTTTTKFNGYKVSNSLEIQVSDLKMATNLIDQAVKGGANRIQYVNFEVSPELLQTVQYNLISYATEDAVNKAELLAEPLSLELVDILTVKLLDNRIAQPVPMNYARMEAGGGGGGGGASAKLYTGQSQQSVSVEVTFSIRNRPMNMTASTQ
jgi:uncharacterized protein YggE